MDLTPELMGLNDEPTNKGSSEKTEPKWGISELTPATEIQMLKGFEWKNDEAPKLRLDEDGYFRDETGAYILFRSGVTGNLPLEQTEVTDLFNSRLDTNLFRQYQRSTLGKGLYTGNTPQAYPVSAGDPNRHMYAIRVPLAEDDIFDSTNLDIENDPPELASKRLAILALSTRLTLHPTENVFEYLYGGKKGVKLFAELPYHLFYGEKLYADVSDENKLGPKWVLIRSQGINDVEVLGRN